MSGFSGDGKRIAALLYGSSTDEPPAGYDGPEDGVIAAMQLPGPGHSGSGWLCPRCYTALSMEIVVHAAGPEFEGFGRPGLGTRCLTCPRLYGEVLGCS